MDTATTELYTLSLHDALPIWPGAVLHPEAARARQDRAEALFERGDGRVHARLPRSAHHPCHLRGQIGRAHVELQSLAYLVCRLLLEKKKLAHSTLARALRSSS